MMLLQTLQDAEAQNWIRKIVEAENIFGAEKNVRCRKYSGADKIRRRTEKCFGSESFSATKIFVAENFSVATA